jgi:hypothetical protein
VEGVKRKIGGDENEWIRKTSGKAKGMYSIVMSYATRKVFN